MPSHQPERRDEVFLFVPEEEVPEALALGASWINGDSRMVRPRPVPPHIDARAFDRWQTREARYAWGMAQLRHTLADIATSPMIEEILVAVAQSQGEAAKERVYLYVTTADMDRVKAIRGTEWDRRRKMYFAAADADLNEVREWLTPSAVAGFDLWRAAQRALTVLLKDAAAKMAAKPKTSGGENDFGFGLRGPRYPREPSRTQAEIGTQSG